jgi:large subunit ribosomal protein L24
MKIKKNDVVLVTTGVDKGKQGKVLKVFPVKGRVLVEGVKMVKRHQKQTSAEQPGGIIEKEAPIDASNVMLVQNDKPVKTGIKILEDGRRVRYAKSTGEVIDR